MKRKIRFHYLKVVRQPGTANQIAGGIALGLFIGLVIPPGGQIFIAFFLATAMGCNRMLAISAVWVTNPFTMPLIYSFYVSIGGVFTGVPFRSAIPTTAEELWLLLRYPNRNLALIHNLAIGALLSGLLTSVVSFYGMKALLLLYRRQKERRKRLFRRKEESTVFPTPLAARASDNESPPVPR